MEEERLQQERRIAQEKRRGREEKAETEGNLFITLYVGIPSLISFFKGEKR